MSSSTAMPKQGTNTEGTQPIGIDSSASLEEPVKMLVNVWGPVAPVKMNSPTPQRWPLRAKFATSRPVERTLSM